MNLTSPAFGSGCVTGPPAAAVDEAGLAADGDDWIALLHADAANAAQSAAARFRSDIIV
jgi:hypothetical protein